jgi:hypothetical protein
LEVEAAFRVRRCIWEIPQTQSSVFQPEQGSFLCGIAEQADLSIGLYPQCLLPIRFDHHIGVIAGADVVRIGVGIRIAAHAPGRLLGLFQFHSILLATGIGIGDLHIVLHRTKARSILRGDVIRPTVAVWPHASGHFQVDAAIETFVATDVLATWEFEWGEDELHRIRLLQGELRLGTVAVGSPTLTLI